MRRILRYVGASSGNMEEGAFRCDANISQRTRDGAIIGPKVPHTDKAFAGRL